VAATGTWAFSVPPQLRRDRIEIIGDKGSISFSTFTFEPVIVTTPEGIEEFENEQPEHVQYYLIEKIVRALEGRGESPSTGISAARTSRVMDDVVQQYYKNKK
jgi:predicted dehydrogenase